MKTAIMVTRGLVGITGLIQLALGIVFWTGHARGLTGFHMITGVVFVLALWTLAGLGARAGAPVGLVVTAFVWGLVLPLFGMVQMRLLVGPSHWVIQTVHMLTAIVAMGLGDRLFILARVGAGGCPGPESQRVVRATPMD